MLNQLKKTTGNSKRKGRGYGSKKGGHTSTKGQKGQKSRSGYTAPRPGFEGGQMPLSRRLPKYRGFRRGYFQQKYDSIAVNIQVIRKLIENGSKDSVLKQLNAEESADKIKVIGKFEGKENKKFATENEKVISAIKELVKAGATTSSSVKELIK